ncbi:hypothetical protein ENHAE0001_1242 [Enhydrobacter aerosaccus SK60]|nr:hypothetical protein ENHAE0001_1242 [Enhydrobacter aerosaccus SK60]
MLSISLVGKKEFYSKMPRFSKKLFLSINRALIKKSTHR